MIYDTYVEYLNQILDADLSMVNLFLMKKIFVNMNRIYRKEIMKQSIDRKKCANDFKEKIDYFNNSVWNKLKDSLDLDDETINRIFAFIKTLDNIEEMYIEDDLVIAKTTNNDKLSTLPEFDFKEITDPIFIRGNVKNTLTNLLVKSINNSVNSLIDQRPTPRDVVTVFDGKVMYLKENVKIYTSHNLSEILSDNTGVKITKVFVTYNNEAYSFDLKIRDGYVILVQNDVELLTKMMNKKQKSK